MLNPGCSTGSEVEDSEGTGIGDRDEEEIKKKNIFAYQQSY